MKISSQKYLDEEIVNKKLLAADFDVLVATIEYDGEIYEIIIDGHHSLAAAKLVGIEPNFEESDYEYQQEVDFIGFDNWLELHWIDCDWYNIETNRSVWR